MNDHPDDIRTDIDPETGELRISAPANGKWAIQDLEYRERVSDRLNWRDWEQEYYTKCNMENIRGHMASVPKNYLAHLLYLQTFIDYKGVLRLVNNHYMLRGDMLRMLKMGERTYVDFMKCMVKNDIIRIDHMDNKTIYAINPEYHLRGESDNKHMVKTFVDEVRRLYETHERYEDLAAIYKLLPYVHMRNVIVMYPYVHDVKKAQPLSIGQIAHIVGVKVDAAYKFMKRLKLGDEYVFESTLGGQRYWINPRIVWRDSCRPDKTLLDIFDIKQMGMDRRADRRIKPKPED